jgi:hypothetical protein
MSSNKDKHLGARFSVKEEKAVKKYCIKNKMKVSDLFRNTVLKEVGHEN